VAGFLIKNLEKMLEDGQWHTFNEVEEAISLSEVEILKIGEFLSCFGIAELNMKDKSLKLSSSFLNLPN
jgi:hypothetical protein